MLSCVPLCADLLAQQASPPVSSPQRLVTTVAGTDFVLTGNGQPALQAPLKPNAVAFDRDGNLYIANPGNNLVERVSPAGIITVVAGNGIQGFSGDEGPAVNAALHEPNGVAVDTAGNLYIADTLNLRIRKVSPNDADGPHFAPNHA